MPNLRITYGDIHADPIRLIKLLHKDNVINLTTDDTLTELTQAYNNKDWPKFRALVQKNITLNLDKKYLRLLGDIFSDRGKSDLLMMILLLELTKKGAKINYLFSNHDADFAYLFHQALERACADKDNITRPPKWLNPNIKEQSSKIRKHPTNPLFFMQNHWSSFSSCEHLLEVLSNIDSDPEITTLNDEISLFFMTRILFKYKLIDYHALSDSEINIYTHAPLTKTAIEQTYRQLVSENQQVTSHIFDNTQTLTLAIDKINEKFSQIILDKKELLKLITNNPEYTYVYDIFWQRYPYNPSLCPRKPSFQLPSFVKNIHGHDQTYQSRITSRHLSLNSMPFIPRFKSCSDDHLAEYETFSSPVSPDEYVLQSPLAAVTC